MADVVERLKVALADRYRVERELGAGGMATVYLAEDLKHHREVAVKVLHPDLVASLGAERFLREIDVTAHLQHPHILPLYDSGQADGFLFYVMPYVPGDSLRARLQRERQLPLADAVRIARGVAAALGYAHERGILHRDIKPENILLVSGEAVVADFGIARAIAAAGGASLTSTGITIGTPTYMSPEQAAAERLDGRSDLYALGCVLYEMLAGDAPFTGATAQVIAARKLSEPVPSLRVARASVTAEVEALVTRSLAVAPADRYQTAEELIGALDRAVSGPVGETRASGGWRPRARRVLTRPTSVLLLAGVSAVVGWLLAREPQARATDDRLVQFDIALPPPPAGQPPDSSRAFSAVAMSRDGRRIAVQVIGRAPEPIYLRDVESGTLQPVAGTEGGQAPFFSPDGESLGWVAEGALNRVRLDGSPPQLICDCGVSLGAVLWLPGDTVVFWSDNKALATVPMSGDGSLTQLFQAPDSTIGQDSHIEPAVSPDGRYLLFTRWNTPYNSSIWLLDRRSGAKRRLIGSGQIPAFVGDRLIVYSTPPGVGFSSIRAVGFDPARGELTTEPVDLGGVAARHLGMSVSASGDLVVLHPPARWRLPPSAVEVDRSGRVARTYPWEWEMGFVGVSPDGQRVGPAKAISPQSEGVAIWILDRAEGTSFRLTDNRGSAAWPVWSPDGKRIAYTANRRGDPAFQIYVIPADGSAEPRQMTQFSGVGMNHADSWTPDGRTLVVQSLGADTKYDLFTVEFERPGELQELLRTPDSEIHAAVSPDGRWLAYASDQNGLWEVYLRPFRRPGAAVKVSSQGGWAPLWSANGEELFYRSTDGAQTWAATIHGGIPSRPKLLIDGSTSGTLPWAHNYGVLPDGGFFLPRGTIPLGLPTATVVLGWRRELERALAAAKESKR